MFSGIIVGAIRLLAPTGEPHLVLSCEVKHKKTRTLAGFFAQTSSGLESSAADLKMGDLGFEPRTSGLRVRCAAVAPVTPAAELPLWALYNNF